MTITNLDPKPYRCDRHGGRWGDDQTCYTCVDEHGVTRPTHDGSLCVYDPRAEFDVGDNPILADFADYWAHSPGVDATRVGAWLDASPEPDDWPNATPEQIDHVRVVLERIVVPGNQKES